MGLFAHAAELAHLRRQSCADHTLYHLRTNPRKPACLHSGMSFHSSDYNCVHLILLMRMVQLTGLLTLSQEALGTCCLH